MPTSVLSAQELDEISRSAIEAARLTEPIVANRSIVERYRNPPADTAFPLEYTFHLIAGLKKDGQGKDCPLTVLDYGCGSGRNAAVLASLGNQVIAFDISPELVDLARKRAEAYNSQIDFMVTSAYDTGLPSDSVDVILAVAIFHHLDLAAAKQEICRVLKRGGVLVLQEPVRDSKWYAYIRSLLPARDQISAFERPLRKEQLDFLCEGFHCESIRRFRLPFISLALRVSSRLARSCWKIDRWLLKSVPSLAHFATIEVRKLTRPVN